MTRLRKNAPAIGTAASTVGVMAIGTTKARMFVQARSTKAHALFVKVVVR